MYSEFAQFVVTTFIMRPSVCPWPVCLETGS